MTSIKDTQPYMALNRNESVPVIPVLRNTQPLFGIRFDDTNPTTSTEPAEPTNPTDPKIFKAELDGLLTQTASAVTEQLVLESAKPKVFELSELLGDDNDDINDLEFFSPTPAPTGLLYLNVVEAKTLNPNLKTLTVNEVKLIQNNFLHGNKLFFVPTSFLERNGFLEELYIKAFKATRELLCNLEIEATDKHAFFSTFLRQQLLNMKDLNAMYLADYCFNMQAINALEKSGALSAIHLLPLGPKPKDSSQKFKTVTRYFPTGESEIVYTASRGQSKSNSRKPRLSIKDSIKALFEYIRLVNGNAITAVAIAAALTTGASINRGQNLNANANEQEEFLDISPANETIPLVQVTELEEDTTNQNAVSAIQDRVQMQLPNVSEQQVASGNPAESNDILESYFQINAVDISTVNQVPGQVLIHTTRVEDGITYHIVDNPFQYSGQSLRVTTVNDPLIVRDIIDFSDTKNRLLHNSSVELNGQAVEVRVNANTIMTYMETTDGALVAAPYLSRISASTASLNTEEDLELEEVIELDESDLIEVVDYSKFVGEQVAYTSAAGKTKNYQCQKVENEQMLLSLPNNPNFSFWVNISTLENENTLNAVKLATKKESQPTQVDFVQDSTSARIDIVLSA